eukprot:scaffold143_cov260-Pinguiococcus_pyrenoidosus.AAC.1
MAGQPDSAKRSLHTFCMEAMARHDNDLTQVRGHCVKMKGGLETLGRETHRAFVFYDTGAGTLSSGGEDREGRG